MKYDFTSIMDRKGRDAIAVDLLHAPGMIPEGETPEGVSRIPMWVADMDFATCPSIIRSVSERLSEPHFGYFLPREVYTRNILEWQDHYHGKYLDAIGGLSEKYIGFENGLLGGVTSALRVICPQGGNVLVHSPVYVGFSGLLENNGYNIITSPLVRDAGGTYRMDYEDMEEKISKHKIHAAIFCSPHNPTGRVWEMEELQRAAEIFRKYDVYVVCDEIWSDLILSGEHIPLACISEDMKHRTMTFYSPAKTFNLSGISGAYHIVFNDYLRDSLAKVGSLSHYNWMNMLSMYAMIGAYTGEGREWLAQLLDVLRENVSYACGFIRDNFRGIQVSDPHGTYMLWLSCEEFCKRNGITIDELQGEGVRAGVIWQDGRRFEQGYNIRMNLALPTSLVHEAFGRLKKAFADKGWI
ncbi:MAG: aminotransferase class I/II-fold pyridoxal phosphate-dependent enzyme [Lachnospiraceae bacterium]|nr:aminotransferase class I/II-fold pyridoxal phosphate-dependent enzyme [Lachnospiraceae bacterium]